MPQVEVTLPDQTETEIDRLVSQGEFLNREQAIEELLAMGMSAYQPVEDETTEEEEYFTGSQRDQQDPAELGDPGDERTL